MSTINYRIHSITSESQNYPASNLLNDNVNAGWQSSYTPTYPQQINIQFYVPIRTKTLKLLFHQYKIPSSVQVFVRMTKKQNWRKLGYVIPNDNSQSNFQHQQIRTLYFQFPCTYIKLLMNKNYKNQMNILEQVALDEIIVQGEILPHSQAKKWNLADDLTTSDEQEQQGENVQESQPSSIHPKSELVHGKNNSNKNNLNDLQLTSTTDQFLRQFAEIYKHLDLLKQQSVNNEDFQNAALLKQVIGGFKDLQKDILKLQAQKRQALQDQDFDKCHRIKQQILRKKETFQYKKQQLLSNESQYMSEHSYSRVYNDRDHDQSRADIGAGSTDKKSDNIRDYFDTPQKGSNSRVRMNVAAEQNYNNNTKPSVDHHHDEQILPALRKQSKPQPLEYPRGDPRNNKDYVPPVVEETNQGNLSQRYKTNKSNKTLGSAKDQIKNTNSSRVSQKQNVSQKYSSNPIESNKSNATHNNNNISSQYSNQQQFNTVDNHSKRSSRPETNEDSRRPSNNYTLPTERSEYEEFQSEKKIGESQSLPKNDIPKSPSKKKIITIPSPRRQKPYEINQVTNPSQQSFDNNNRESTIINPDDRPINPQRPEQLKELEEAYEEEDQQKKQNQIKFQKKQLKQKIKKPQTQSQSEMTEEQYIQETTKSLISKYGLEPLGVNQRLKLQHYFSVIRQPYWQMIYSKNWKTKKDALEIITQTVQIIDKQSYMAGMEFVSICIGDKHTQVVVATLNLLSQIIGEGSENNVTFSLAHLPYFIQGIMTALLGNLSSTNKQLFEHSYNLYLNFGMVSFLSIQTLIHTLIKYKQSSAKLDHKLMLNKFSLMISIVEKYAQATSKYFKDIVTWGTMYLQDPNNKVKSQASYLMLIMVDMIGEEKVINIIKSKPKALEALFTLLNSSSLMSEDGNGGQKSRVMVNNNNNGNQEGGQVSKVFQHNDSRLSGKRNQSGVVNNRSSVSQEKQQHKHKNQSTVSNSIKNNNKKVQEQPRSHQGRNPWEQPAKYKEQVSSKNSIESPSRKSHTNVELEYSRNSEMYQHEEEKKQNKSNRNSAEQKILMTENQYSQNFQSENEIRVMEDSEEEQQQDEGDDNPDLCDFCFQHLNGMDQRTHLIRQCKIISSCEECYGRIYLREMTDHMLYECKYKEFHQKCKKCGLCFKIDEINQHIAQGSCRSQKGQGWQRCQFCYEDIQAHDMKWAEHAQKCTNLPEIYSEEGDQESSIDHE